MKGRFFILGCLAILITAIGIAGCHREEEAPVPQPEKMAEQAQQPAAQPEKPIEQAQQPAVPQEGKQSKDLLIRTTTEVFKSAEEKPIIPPVEVVFETTMGDVAFPHQTHSEMLKCEVCHGQGTPAKIPLDKESAHKLCRGCHEEKAAGPTKCPDCHKK